MATSKDLKKNAEDPDGGNGVGAGRYYTHRFRFLLMSGAGQALLDPIP